MTERLHYFVYTPLGSRGRFPGREPRNVWVLGVPKEEVVTAKMLTGQWSFAGTIRSKNVRFRRLIASNVNSNVIAANSTWGRVIAEARSLAKKLNEEEEEA